MYFPFFSKFDRIAQLAICSVALLGSLATMQLPAVAVPAAEIGRLAESDSGLRPPLKEGLKYSYGKEALSEFSRAVSNGKKAIDQALLKANGDAGKLCIVSDIDETLLDNRPFIEREVAASDKEVNWSQFEGWVQEASGKLLKP
ncbi:MAG TPA: hypothetical protein PK683_22360, partial [Leptospiraceae bacterium]|nr:hypothetical protein [Leptospiraceae bacterium]